MRILFTKISYLCICKPEIGKQTMNNKIKHGGIIDSIEGNHIRVRISQFSACSSCKIAGHCNASESKEKIIDVYSTGGTCYTKGQEVTVFAFKDVANKALALGFGGPFLLMLATLFATYQFSHSEAIAALSSIAILIPYFVMIWLCRNKISQHITFQIEETNV